MNNHPVKFMGVDIKHPMVFNKCKKEGLEVGSHRNLRMLYIII